MMKLIPLRDWVVLRRDEVLEKTDSGILLPESTRGKPQEGKVVATGRGCLSKLQQGDKVVFAKYAGTEIQIGDEKALIIREKDIFAMIVDD